ncbi:MAG: hypothetical protein JRI91_14910 [Deltaproteobacteria bacterium]|nr:hypothetical protein [Deltaproteobacteria bacterium]
MKTLGKFIGVFVVVGFLVMVCFGCSSDSGSSTPSNLSTRVNVLVAENGTLTPVVQSAGERTVSATDQSWEYTLTLENVSDEVVWYTDRPGRDSGTETVQTYIALWSGMYGDVSPNAVLDGHLNEEKEETTNDGLYLKLEEPLYDSKMDRLTFQVTLLDSTMVNKHPDIPLSFDHIKITVLNNSPEGETDNWSFAQVAPDAFFEPTGTEGVYRFYLNDVYPELYQIQNAPGSGSEINTAASFADNWQFYFSSALPNASLTAYTAAGELRVVILELNNPSYQGNIFSYDATVLLGNVEEDLLLFNTTLLIDSPDNYTRVILTNKQANDITVNLGFIETSCYQPPDFSDLCKVEGTNQYVCTLTLQSISSAPNNQKEFVFKKTDCHANISYAIGGDLPWTGCVTTQAEFTIYSEHDGRDTIDISLVNGFSVPVSIVSSEGTTYGPVTSNQGYLDTEAVYPFGCSTCQGRAPVDCNQGGPCASEANCQVTKNAGATYTVNILGPQEEEVEDTVTMHVDNQVQLLAGCGGPSLTFFEGSTPKDAPNNQVTPITVSNLFGVNKIGFQVNGWYWRCGGASNCPNPNGCQNPDNAGQVGIIVTPDSNGGCTSATLDTSWTLGLCDGSVPSARNVVTVTLEDQSTCRVKIEATGLDTLAPSDGCCDCNTCQNAPQGQTTHCKH